MQTFDPQKCSMNALGHTVVGYGDGTFMKAAYNEQQWFTRVGADGKVIRIRNANRTGYIEITLLAGSPSNDVLSAFAKLDYRTAEGVGTVFIKDNTSDNAKAMASKAWIQQVPDLVRSKEMGEDVTWRIDCADLDLDQGGTTDA